MHNKRLYNRQQILTDYGPEPFITDIHKATIQNTNYRTALWTGNNLQLTLMSIPVGCEIGLETHPQLDQFIKIEEGFGLSKMGKSNTNLNQLSHVSRGYSVFVPAGTWHNIVNTGNQPLKLYSIYAPIQHPYGTVQKTKEIADLEEKHKH